MKLLMIIILGLVSVTTFADETSLTPLNEEYCVGMIGVGVLPGHLGMTVRCGNHGKKVYSFEGATFFTNRTKLLNKVADELKQEGISFVTSIEAWEGVLYIYKKGAVDPQAPKTISILTRSVDKYQENNNHIEDLDLYLSESVTHTQGMAKSLSDYSNAEKLANSQGCIPIAKVLYVDNRFEQKDYILISAQKAE